MIERIKMKKRYLKTVEDVLALKDTKTKIYFDFDGADDLFLQFIDGVLCENVKGEFKYINHILCLDDKPYILVEEQEQEATEEDLNKMCKFWDTEADEPRYSILEKIFNDSDFPFMDSCCDTWEHCRKLTPSEVAEITGYGVTEDGSTFCGEPFRVVGKEKEE